LLATGKQKKKYAALVMKGKKGKETPKTGLDLSKVKKLLLRRITGTYTAAFRENS
jgi:hypothetical protein